MATAVKEEVWELNQSVSGITSRDLVAKTADGSLVPIYEYAVPVGDALVFDGNDKFSAYLQDDGVGDTECEGAGVDSVKVDIVIMDANKQNVRCILNKIKYDSVSEFQDEDVIVRLDIAQGEQVIAREDERVCIRANCPGTVASLEIAECYFRLTCKRIRHTLF